MRPTKFRGKRKDNGEWVFGDLVHYIGRKNGIDIPATVIQFDTFLGLETFEVDPATVGQYTGLNDKDGKEIWEEDIMKSLHPMEVKKKNWLYHFVKFDVSYSCFAAISAGCYDENLTNNVNVMLFVYIRNAHEISVIGNIHDNPELLKP